MPNYLFENPKTKEVKEVFFHMNEEKRYFDEDGKEWARLFTVPAAQMDTEINEFSGKDFAEKTKNKNYNLGDLWDKSAELSEKREKKAGKDFVKEKAAEDYKKRTGKTHPLSRKKITKIEI
jgi:hypothetical protein